MAEAIKHPNIYYVQPLSGDTKWLESNSFTVRLWDGGAQDYEERDELSSTKPFTTLHREALRSRSLGFSQDLSREEYQPRLVEV